MTAVADFLRGSLFPVVLTLLAYQVGLFCQKKTGTALCNPILIGVVLVLGVLALTRVTVEEYRTGMNVLSWLMTPATVCLAIPMYEQFQILKKNLRGILAGVLSGALACLAAVLVLSLVLGFDRTLTVSLLPKSVTTAIGAPLSELSGGSGPITTAAIILTGILANVLSMPLFRLFRLTDPIVRGVALGTSGHVIGTAKAGELDPLTGAVSSLSLVTAGLLTAAVFPLLTRLIP